MPTSPEPPGPAQRDLDLYDIAFLAGGGRRVAETALITLRDRGVLKVRGSRARPGDTPAEEGELHPVEWSLADLCAELDDIAVLLDFVHRGPEVVLIRAQLMSDGSLTLFRHRLTALGRRRLTEAQARGTWPAHVFEGSTALKDRRLARTLDNASLPSGLGRALARMGRALDSDHGPGGSDGADHGSSGGGGGGGD